MGASAFYGGLGGFGFCLDLFSHQYLRNQQICKPVFRLLRFSSYCEEVLCVFCEFLDSTQGRS